MSTYYVQILSVQAPFDIGVDANNRSMFSVNFNVTCASPSDKLEREIAKILSDAGLVTLGTNLFIGSRVSLPVGDGPYSLLRLTGGSSPEEGQNCKYENQSIQIVTYAKDYEVGIAKIRSIWNLLDGKRNVTVAAV